MLLRCTTKLATALRLGALPRIELAEAQAPLSEWYANIVRTSAGRLVVLMEAQTRLVVLSPHAHAVRLMNDLEGRIASLLRSLAFPDAIVSDVVQGLGTTQFAKTADRKLIGALNEACSCVAVADERRGLARPGALDDLQGFLAHFVHRMPGTFPDQVAREILWPDRAGVTRASAPLELVVHTCADHTMRCHALGTTREVVLHARAYTEVPGEILVVQSAETWEAGGETHVEGKVVDHRCDAKLLGLSPLALEDRGAWDPDDAYWGEEGDPLPAWATAIVARGPRSCFEMEQVLPGVDADDFDADPILASIDLADAGDTIAARAVLMGLLAQDLRCLDAHAHLGNLAFDHTPERALRHYTVGTRIGELSLGARFDGVLPWRLIDNRPFLRCMNGRALCLWRLNQVTEAAEIFRDLLWKNPDDNQGARFNLAAIEAGKSWTPD